MRHWFIYIATLLLVGHNLTPHHHPAAASIGLAPPATCAHDFAIFCHDLGADHLENYQTATAKTLPATPAPVRSFMPPAKPEFQTISAQITAPERACPLPYQQPSGCPHLYPKPPPRA